MNEDFPLIVWRESVCAGDDCEAPHERVIAVSPDSALREVAAKLLDSRYLPSIAGGKATWILDGERPLLVFARQWTEPRFLAPPDSLVADCIRIEARPHLRFRYWCQVDPDRVFDCLMSGAPLPDRYGR